MKQMNHEVWINRSLDKVYEAISTIEGLSKWWTTDTTEEDNTLTFGFYNHKYWFKFRVLNKEKNTSVDWECVDSDEQSGDWKGTKINFLLEENEGQIILKFTHSNWSDDSKIFAMCNTTWGHLMHSLKNYVENGKGEPMS